MTESQCLGGIIVPSKTPLLFMCQIARVSSVESSSREETRCPHIGLLSLGISRRLVDSCLDCRVHEVTLPTHIAKFFLVKQQQCADDLCHGEWVAQPRSTEVRSCAFPCEVFAPVALESSLYVARRSSSRVSATSFILLSSVDVLGLPGLGSLSMLTQLPRKQLAQRETVLRSTVNSPQTSLKAPWISVGLCRVKFRS